MTENSTDGVLAGEVIQLFLDAHLTVFPDLPLTDTHDRRADALSFAPFLQRGD